MVNAISSGMMLGLPAARISLMPDASTISPLRILVVDDEANIRMTLSMCLEADGHSVVAESNIPDALDAIARQVFDLVFLDVRPGGGEGGGGFVWGAGGEAGGGGGLC